MRNLTLAVFVTFASLVATGAWAVPGTAQSAYEVGRQAVESKDYAAAIAAFTLAIELDPSRADAHYSLGLVFRTRERWVDALSAFRHSISTPAAPAEAYCQVGELQMEVFGQVSEAVGHLRRAIEVDPTYPRGYRLLGFAQLRQGDPTAAVEAFEQAWQLDPTSAETAYGLGVARGRLDDLEGARAALSTATYLDPHHAKSHLALGNCLTRLGQAEEGRVSLDTFRRLTAEMEQIAHLNRATVRDPSDTLAWSELARIHMRREEWADAAKALERVVGLGADGVAAPERLGFVYYRLARYAEAAEAFEEVVQRRPDVAAYRNSLAGTYLMLDDAPRAVEQFEAAVQLDPTDARLQLNLANAHEQAGNSDAASTALATYESMRAGGR
jgi:protein O-GlcNAc transferase